MNEEIRKIYRSVLTILILIIFGGLALFPTSVLGIQNSITARQVTFQNILHKVPLEIGD
jgi:hypothetical protein